MAALLYCAGMRIEEVLGLRWEDIDTEIRYNKLRKKKKT